LFEIDKKKLGSYIAKLRRERGYTQKELAERLFVSDKTISKWETGVNIPDTALLIPLSNLLGVTVTELLIYRTNYNERYETDRRYLKSYYYFSG
jgi:transcriptional regulator with XRE-family HTH domain